MLGFGEFFSGKKKSYTKIISTAKNSTSILTLSVILSPLVLNLKKVFKDLIKIMGRNTEVLGLP